MSWSFVVRLLHVKAKPELIISTFFYDFLNGNYQSESHYLYSTQSDLCICVLATMQDMTVLDMVFTGTSKKW